jgi:molybdate transport system permease protein
MKPWRWQPVLMVVLGGVLAAYLVVPLLILVAATRASFADSLGHPLVWAALRLSLMTTAVSVLVIVGLGTPLAWLIANASSRWARALETLLQLPVVVPPAVAGVALLLTFGRRGVLGELAGADGWSPTFTSAAVVMAEIFVSAPFFLQAATAAFRRVDPSVLLVARTMGASPLRVLLRVALPLSAPGLLSGAAMSWARGLGEFGATLMFAGNLEGRTQTLPLAIYTALETDLQVAQALSVVLIALALTLLVGLRVVSRALEVPR